LQNYEVFGIKLAKGCINSIGSSISLIFFKVISDKTMIYKKIRRGTKK